MKQYILFAIVAGVAWGIGGYFEKAGLREMGIGGEPILQGKNRLKEMQTPQLVQIFALPGIPA